MEITTRTGDYYGDGTNNHIFEMVDNGEKVGELYINADHLVIMNIEVSENHRGEGIARQLYEAADETLGGIYHAPEWGCTPEGLAFSEAVGGDRIDDETMIEITGTDLSFLNVA